MKKSFTYRLCIVIIFTMLVILFLSYYLQIRSAEKAAYTSSLIRINQVTQLIEKNDLDTDRLKRDLEEDYFIRAKAAAYIIQTNPDIIGNLTELQKVASLLRVDELHLFDEEGVLFDGTIPLYYGYTFNSGTQMQYFLPMLEDRTLQLCQEVTPNTAENKDMQYLAVWREDGQGIIQIGMEPVRLVEAMAKNELNYMFGMMTVDEDTTIFVIDPQTGSILGSTSDDLTGKTALESGIPIAENVYNPSSGVFAQVDGVKSYCVVKPAGNLLVGASTTYDGIFRTLRSNMVLAVVSLCILSVIVILLILQLLDKYIIHGIQEMVLELRTIAAGDLDKRVNVNTSPEFIELSANINHMIVSLIENTGKLSLAFENVNLPIAIYEYNQDMTRVLATSKLGDILIMSSWELQEALSDHVIFSRKIDDICKNPYTSEDDVYLIGLEDPHYVRIKFYQENNRTFGIVVDKTQEILEKQQIRQERDIDLLTGLYSRRAFFREMDKLFVSPQLLQTAVLLMIDMDNLKYTNDTYGHEYGDKLLKKAADLLSSCEAPQKIAARLGGDEFALLIYGNDSEETAQAHIDQLYQQVQNACLQVNTDTRLPICFSGGYVFYPEHDLNYEELIKLADKAMYTVKKGEKGHFAKY